MENQNSIGRKVTSDIGFLPTGYFYYRYQFPYLKEIGQRMFQALVKQLEKIGKIVSISKQPETNRIILVLMIFLILAGSCKEEPYQPVWKSKINDFTELRETFKDPPLWYAPHTFWFWDAPLDANQTTEMAKQMTRQRLNPGYTHARRGLPEEQWLSEEWFDTFRRALKAAKKTGMTLAYNDEYWWPSGQAAGRVLESRPDLKASSLRYSKKTVEGVKLIEIPESKFSVAGRLNENGQIITGTLEVIGEGPAFEWKPPAGTWAVWSYETYHHAGIDGGLVNYLDTVLMDVFIPIAHEPYEARFKKDMGSSIPGVFVDNEGDFGWKMAWSEYLPVRYEEMKDRDIRTWMPLLTEEDEDGLWASARYDWFDVVSDIYCTHFLGRLSNWLEKRDMFYITNLWEESLQLITQAVGDLMRAQRSVSMPGNDAIDMRSQNAHDFKETQSVCEFEDRPFMCEIMGVRGWSQTPDDMKRTVNLVTAWGVNHIVAHGIYNNRKLTNIPFPADWYNENPYFEYLDLWTDFARRASYVNRQGKLVADVLMINPLGSAWALSGNYFDDVKSEKGEQGGTSEFDYKSWDPRVVEMNRLYTAAMEQLTTFNIDYLIADRHYMELARIGSSTITIGDHSFSAIVLPPAFIISRETAAKILAFAKRGGVVVLLGDLPVGSPEKGATDDLIQKQMQELRKQPGVIDLSREPDKIEKLPDVLAQRISPQFRNLSGDLDLVFSHREIAGSDFYWIVSRSNDPGICSLQLRDGKGRAEIWDCETGEIKPVPFQKGSSGNLVELEFQPYQAYWLVFNANELPLEDPPYPKPFTELVLDKSPWLLSLPESGTVKVSTAEILMSPLDVPNGKLMEVPDAAWTWQKILGEVKITEPWQSEMFYIPEPTTTFYYRYSFDLGDFPEQGFLNISADDLLTLWVNGTKLEQSENSRIWYKTDTYVIGEFIKKGKNTIAAEVVNTGGPGSFMLQGRYKTKDGEAGMIETDGDWKESRTLAAGWHDPVFDDSNWESPFKATEKVYNERIELFDNPKKNIGPHEYVWWRINVPPGTILAEIPGISDQAMVWCGGEQLSIRNSQVELPDEAQKIYIRHDPRAYSDQLTSPVVFHCEGQSPGKPGSWYDLGLHRYSGFVDYETTFSLDNPYSEVILDLGSVLYMAEVWINGKNAGSRLWRPFRYDISGFIKEGENSVRIRVGNLVHNEMCLINDVEETINFWGKTGIPLLEDLDAGLFGPVKIKMKK